MLARSRLIRVTAAVVPALLALAACGTKAGYGDPTTAGFGAVAVSGDYGKTPDLTWKAMPAYPGSTRVSTIHAGTGPAMAGKSADLHIYIADPDTDVNHATTACDSSAASPSSSPTAADSPSAPASSSTSPIPTPVPIQTCGPVTWPLQGSWVYQTPDGKYDTIQPQSGSVWSTILAGAKVGSRIEALTGSDVVWPETSSAPAGKAQIGVGTHDPLLVVVDVERITPVSPTPSDAKAHQAAAGSMPKVIQKAGKPTGLDWSGVTKPALTTPVQVQVLKQGHGAAVKSTDTVTVNYLGETYKAKKPFDESYTKTPMTQSLSGLVKGWGIGLTGVKVGSRVLLQIPPYYGYGASDQNGIPGNSTMWFVIDVIKATKGS